MTITAKLQAQDPSSIPMTLTITMTMGEWVALGKRIDSDYPGWKIHALITNLTSKAVAHFDAVDQLEP